MKEITPTELKEWIDCGKEFQLIDIREDHEVANCNIGGKHIPMAEVLENIDRLRTDIPVVIHCQSGKRSGAVVFAIEMKFRLSNIYSLSGGIVEWGKQIDDSLECL
ncbi:MAG: rhodanese-like domain-containing protein [Crocinitomicaceae bacterium]|nr:rhodanese-like domain-containing protein [Crocinitomicaceae bacterium]